MERGKQTRAEAVARAIPLSHSIYRNPDEGSFFFDRFSDGPLFRVTNVQDVDNSFTLVDAKDDPVRLEDQIAKGALKIIVLSCKSTALGHLLQRVNLFIQSLEPFFRV